MAAGPEIWDELPPEDAEMQGKCVEFPMRPTKQDVGGTLAQFVDSEVGAKLVAVESAKVAARTLCPNGYRRI